MHRKAPHNRELSVLVWLVPSFEALVWVEKLSSQVLNHRHLETIVRLLSPAYLILPRPVKQCAVISLIFQKQNKTQCPTPSSSLQSSWFLLLTSHPLQSLLCPFFATEIVPCSPETGPALQLFNQTCVHTCWLACSVWWLRSLELGWVQILLCSTT